jgi:ATP-dependent helicase/nuclease subunit A
MKKDKRKYHRGRLIHKLLEILPDTSPQHRRPSIERFLSQDAHEITYEQKEQITNEVLDIFENSDLEGLFGESSRAEVPIVGQVGDFTLSGQVDRLAIQGNEVLIVDYKTNRPPARSPEKIPKIYQRQMAAYKAVLKEIYPKKHVRCFLLWTDIAELMEIPEGFLNKFTF